MENSFIQDWIDQIKPLFPSNAKIILHDEGNVSIKVWWKLGTDPNRPQKRSRILKIIISSEAIADCNNPINAGKKVKAIIENKMLSFDPEHNESADASTPIDALVISTLDIN
ncbi:MAG: hypothetical protein PF503_17765 [Desulfobacula sp.]|jgi:hypothetical protein|nr:hypothetical protein [Desulfobacula sp.]